MYKGKQTNRQKSSCTPSHLTLLIKVRIQRRRQSDEEGGGVFSGVGEMRKSLLGISIPTQTLSEAEPGRQTSDEKSDDIGRRMSQANGVGFGFGWHHRRRRDRRPRGSRFRRGQSGTDGGHIKWLADFDLGRNIPIGWTDEEIETDQIFKVQKQSGHGVELIGQPEVGEGDVVKRRRENAEEDLDGPETRPVVEDGERVEEKRRHEDDDGERMDVDRDVEGGVMRDDEEEEGRAPDDG